VPITTNGKSSSIAVSASPESPDMTSPYDWREVHKFWFPPTLASADHDGLKKMLAWWMGGGATPELQRFEPTVEAARAGQLDEWRTTPVGRLSLIVILDQFPRGLFAGTAAAYSSDSKALQLAEEGFDEGHYDALSDPWEKGFFLMPLTHTEGPRHLQRLEKVVAESEKMLNAAPEHLKKIFEFALGQARGHLDVISRFGRFPHRNAVLGRASSPDESVYHRERRLCSQASTSILKAAQCRHHAANPTSNIGRIVAYP
jgi:uncharacterized protein (DUF924 family)